MPLFRFCCPGASPDSDLFRGGKLQGERRQRKQEIAFLGRSRAKNHG